MMVMYIGSPRLWGRYVVGFMVMLSFAGMVIPRLLIAPFVKTRPSRVLISGAGELGRDFCARIEGRKGFEQAGNFEVVGFLDCDPERAGQEIFGHKVLGCLCSSDDDFIETLEVDVVVLCAEKDLKKEEASVYLNLPLKGIEVLTKAAFIEQYYKEVSVRYSNPHSFAAYPSLPGNASIFAFKRLVDIFGALAGLVMTILIWPVLAVAIKLDSPGPILFKQIRVGFHGRNFEILKFRTMGQDAEKDGAKWAVKGDLRVTRIGKILRVSRLDELPQLINVLRGDMSLVGPRPERPEFVSDLAKEIPFFERRHMVPPGLTGWAQICYRYGASVDDAQRKLQFDLYYIRHLSPGLDLKILLKTVPMMMKGSR